LREHQGEQESRRRGYVVMVGGGLGGRNKKLMVPLAHKKEKRSKEMTEFTEGHVGGIKEDPLLFAYLFRSELVIKKESN